jgi:hypothetical protein
MHKFYLVGNLNVEGGCIRFSIIPLNLYLREEKSSPSLSLSVCLRAEQPYIDKILGQVIIKWKSIQQLMSSFRGIMFLL